MKILLFLSSVRASTPPKPIRLGERVSKACLSFLTRFYGQVDVELIDPLDYKLESIFKPHFAYSKKTVPEDLDKLANKIQQADGYIMLSPEYNHSISPALANLLNHFGSSLFSYKPSAIVTYSAGQWGGMRAAVGMRTFLGELGCLPVSAMIHVPYAQDVFDEHGDVNSGQDLARWDDYFYRTFAQLLWWAEAAKEKAERQNPHTLLSSFLRSPSERNTPGEAT